MRRSLQLAALALVMVATGAALPSEDAGYFGAPREASVPTASAARLDQLLAPIALYPDSLLTQVLVASTYPLEVVALHRWLEQRPGLAGDALQQELAAQPWDGSVKALAPFPRVVATMNEQLDWMQSVGNAFLAQQDDVMQSIQRLRSRAAAAGNLQDESRVRVAGGEGEITIEYVEPGVVYVPSYDPAIVYGPWVWPEYPPYYWGPWHDWPWAFYAGGIYFGYGVYVGSGWHDHPHTDWHGRHVEHPGGQHSQWRHNPSHRGGVPYPDHRTRQQYIAPGRPSYRGGGEFRGFDAPRATQRAPLGPQSNPATRAQSQRGHSSLGSGPSRPPQSSHAPPRSSAPSAPHANPAARPSPGSGGRTR